ncbi:MAG: amino acid adenylation domain-containing protein [Microcystis sp. M53603_WE2]|jgi:amino acid adenylation domain-containing protein/non-ribosomal peptide synthase protein (TIGR01720 family)|uniref:non-ribosomal peptide synthetase n=1 Tax=unclassified Microcystis TaxID=2643300 RepID=UPI0022BD0296|nr:MULTISPECIES: non-ribosomal peptide synthetase [unclassified Microcystis]MCE2661402.1 amino acid adenylation domain-containing protein [Microcystis sp. 53602_E8]MDJ0565723.1 amino acid adenylation domain-containing protein [Microcystis sp. M49629_WE12]MCZ8024204.1 amino acid adenylation domain-containing protein [Microcystis sp. LE19-10.1B]MDJ0537587.1 amino acid adenylation domain-containing protein [Microcystis sp. M53603_WE2]MDJ0602445.1 amino acid adenylation domain-containing protein [
MKVAEFLSYLNSLDIKLWLEEEKLKYQAPQGAMTPEIKQEIGTRKPEILTFLRSATTPSKPLESVIDPVARTEELPLSFAQQRMWFLYQMDRQNPAYNEALTIRLTGRLNIDILEQTINAIIQRHESLRTSFPMVEGKPIQKIAPSLKIKLLVVNLKDIPQEQIDKQIIEELQKPFDLTQSPLLRCTLFDLGYENYILVNVFHHIIIDGWSKGILFKELSKFYQALLSNSTVDLPELAIQYADFAVWQRQWLQGEILENQLNYWKKQLTGAPPLLELPTDKPRPATANFRGHSISFQIDSELTEKLKLLSQKSGVTLFMTLLAALNTLLFRYSGQDDILIGTPTANRNRQEIEPLIGFFVNTLVLRNSLEGNPTFSGLLQQARNVVLEAYANQDVPFEQVVDGLEIERSLSYNPLFQVMFALQNAPLNALKLPNLKAQYLAVENQRIKFDLSLFLEEIETEKGSYLEGFWEYDGDLFTPERITRMVGHFQTLLKGIVANPQQTIGELPLLTESEKQQLLVEWNQTQTSYPDHYCIHQLFEEQVVKTPDAIAVIDGEKSLTYEQLNQKANQLAYYLQNLGVKTEDLVGICIERSVLMIIGLLGILKAGAAYIPLDPNYPSERLAYMLEDSAVSVLLTQENLVDTLPNYLGTIFCLDQDGKILDHHPQDNLLHPMTSENLAYVIYTSGSTGKPKGVLIQHQSLLNLVSWHQNAFDITTIDRVTQLAGIAFDASVWEIWPYLTAGACLAIVPPDLLTSPKQLQEWLIAKKITVSFLPTPLAETLIPLDWSPNCLLRLMLTGGDKLNDFPPTSIPFTLVNNYGPTENTVVTTSVKITPDLLTEKAPPIGRPISNTQVYILDQYQQPVPIGIPGELYIGGSGLAKGYLNRPELTDSKFIANPFSQKLSDRLYKTGDLVRYGNDGQIEFVGRIDHQVKIRGFRIELGEIETVLNQHPQVKEAIIIAREDQPGVKRLCAYVIASQNLTVSQLRLFLQEKLPQYMVPAFFVLLDAFPLTANGKIDRCALPQPTLELEDEAALNLSPGTEKERILAAIWQRVLGLKNISINDNFFELGGDSILAIQIIAQANQAGLQITPKQLFSHQTIAQLATVAERVSVNQTTQDLVIGHVPLTPIQKWFFEQNLPERHHFNQSILLEVPNNLQPDLLKKTISKLLYHHDALRLRFVHKGEQWQQNHSDDCNNFAFEKVDLSHLSCDEQLTKMAEISEVQQRVLNLEEGPLMAVVFFALGESGKMLIVIHHLAVDGISWRIILEDFVTIYQQLENQKPLQLPPKTSSFKTWAEELQNYAKTPEFYAQFKYWLNREFPSICPLPLDRQGEAQSNIVAHAKTVSFTLTEEQTRLLLQEVPQAYNTQINDILLTALVQAFGHWTGNYGLLLDMEGHGRENVIESVNLSRTVGWFTSIFPVFLTLENLHHPGECLKSIKEQLRQIPNRGFDYGIGYYLSSDLTIQSPLKNYPKAQISFNYLGQFTSHQIGEIGWKLSQESSGSIHSPLGKRSHLIAIHGIVVDGQLDIEWQYSENFHHQTTIKNLAAAYRDSLESLINHCLSVEGGYTPSDFPDADLNQVELDELLSELDF